MLELLFLLLPIAAAYGYIMGYRSAKKDQTETNNKFTRDYMTGVDYLLSNQVEKAVDLFLSLSQKSPSDGLSTEDNPDSQFEAQLTLGNLFRSRGEVDRAIRIHQQIDRSEDYTYDQKLLAKEQLAKDFLSVGFLDRAENLFILLVSEPDYAENALQQLCFIYQKTKEWEKAIDVATKLAILHPQTNNIPLAHYYCFQAISQQVTDPQERFNLLNQALQVSPSCVRASMLLAEQALDNYDYPQALIYLKAILNQNPDYISEILTTIKGVYHQLHKGEDYELFLIQAFKLTNNSQVFLALMDWLEKNEGLEVAQKKLYEQIRLNPTPLLFERFVAYLEMQTQDPQSKHSLKLIQETFRNHIQKTNAYSCVQCGYQSNILYWCCPSCNQWEQIKPVNSLYL